MNESILVAVCYHFVLFANPVWKADFREQLGVSVISFVCLLLFANTVLILWSNLNVIKLLCRKYKYKRMSKKHEQQKLEEDQKKKWEEHKQL